MYKDTNLRSITKGISWRITGTVTTIIIIYLFFGRLDLAIIAGFSEIVLKVILFWFHERIWLKIKWGRKKIEPFNLWFVGIPFSKKTAIANSVYKELKKLDILIERINCKNIGNIVSNQDLENEKGDKILYKIGHLLRILQNNLISTVCTFSTPYQETIKELIKNNITVYVKANIESCKQRDYLGIYEDISQNELDEIYDKQNNAHIVINMEELSINEATNKIIKFIRKNYIK